MSKAEGIVLYICMACVALSALAWMGLSASGWWRRRAGHEENACCEDGCC
ncbi:hypothetical protein LJC04_05860 [Ruminococcaceae bacterium OttesenSCG-928-O06]|nr:hypothetical protein [Ruminococcaceae bacterium OttesenSCG-928-O06]